MTDDWMEEHHKQAAGLGCSFLDSLGANWLAQEWEQHLTHKELEPWVTNHCTTPDKHHKCYGHCRFCTLPCQCDCHLP